MPRIIRHRNGKIETKIEQPKFDPKTDYPLSHFSTKKVLVHRSFRGNYKLICNGYLVMLLQTDGYLYCYNYTQELDEIIRAFLGEYTPSVNADKFISKCGYKKGHCEPTEITDMLRQSDKRYREDWCNRVDWYL